MNLGTRQNQRERGKNVIDARHERASILEAVQTQLKHGRYSFEPIYGNGTAGQQIADILAKLDKVQVQKRITY